MAAGSGNKIGLWAAVSIGIGGMVGGGIFAVLGLAVQLAHGGTPEAFALAGIVALLTTYSYARLSVTFPSRGGTVTFLDRAFGTGMLTGSLNVLLWLSYVVMLSLYAFAFGNYAATFLPGAWQPFGEALFISARRRLHHRAQPRQREPDRQGRGLDRGDEAVILVVFIVAGASGIDRTHRAGRVVATASAGGRRHDHLPGL